MARVAPDLKLYLHPRDLIEYLLLRGIPYEPQTLAFIAANLAAGDAAVLAGTNFGLHVTQAARSVGAAGLVIGVEPQPAALLRTRMNLQLNGIDARVRLVQAALGRTDQLVRMAWSNPQNPGAASLLDSGECFFVQMLRLQTVFSLVEGRRLRLLLLDIQGYEFEALSALDLRRGPELIVVELDPEFLRRAGVRAPQISELLADAGYSLFDLQGTASPDLLALSERNLVAVKQNAEFRWVTTAGAESSMNGDSRGWRRRGS